MYAVESRVARTASYSILLLLGCVILPIKQSDQPFSCFKRASMIFLVSKWLKTSDAFEFGVSFLLSSYMEYIFRLSRAVAAVPAAAVDRNLCHAYSLDHKT
jgi:hypothetical protein